MANRMFVYYKRWMYRIYSSAPIFLTPGLTMKNGKCPWKTSSGNVETLQPSISDAGQTARLEPVVLYKIKPAVLYNFYQS